MCKSIYFHDLKLAMCLKVLLALDRISGVALFANDLRFVTRKIFGDGGEKGGVIFFATKSFICRILCESSCRKACKIDAVIGVFGTAFTSEGISERKAEISIGDKEEVGRSFVAGIAI